jgi:F0F1-type ATP synthase assembly protein I
MTPDEERGGPEHETGTSISKIGPLFTSGLELAVSVGIMCLIGYFLDGRFGTTPWLMVAGIFLGAVAGFYLFIKTITSVEESMDEGKTKKGKDA